MDFAIQLGMGEMFGGLANLHNLVNTNDPLHVKNVIHKAFIEINEEYSEGAAAQGKKRIKFWTTLLDECTTEHTGISKK